MRIALPVVNGNLCMHFGHCEAFALVDIDPESKAITGQEMVAAPPHAPGFLPPWLADMGAEVVIAGGMGQRAQALFAQSGIEVVVGAPAAPPDQLARAYLDGTLQTGQNVCDH